MAGPPLQFRRTLTPDKPSPALAEGEVAIAIANTPSRESGLPPKADMRRASWNVR
jgi:hypothetical protein